MPFSKFSLLLTSAFAGLVTVVSAQGATCPDALRFGSLSLSQTDVAPGELFTITSNLTCAVQLGNTPTFLEYYIDGVSTANIGGPIFLGRTTYDASRSPPQDQLSLTLPIWFYNANATYSVRMDDFFARDGPTGEPVITVGSISTRIDITGI